jgi:predicted metal-dependent enzyme (double-stranded beta helix superfamily)
MLAEDLRAVPPGCRDLIEALGRAVAAEDVRRVTRGVQVVLSEYATAGRVDLPAELREPNGDSYARRLIYRSPRPAYSVLAMVWGPRQGTPVHDHSGLWCVEGVVEGRLAVTQYDLVERQGERCRFRSEGSSDAGVGSSGRLIPPFDYHTIANTSGDECAITIHVYGGEMVQCKIYEPLGGDWYRESVRELSYSA